MPPTRCDDYCRNRTGPFENYPPKAGNLCHYFSKEACNNCQLEIAGSNTGGYMCYGAYDTETPVCKRKEDEKGNKLEMNMIFIVSKAGAGPPCSDPCTTISASTATTWERSRNSDTEDSLPIAVPWYVCVPLDPPPP